MTEAIKARTIDEAKLILHSNSSKEKLEELAQMVDEQTLQLLAAAAIGLSWEDKNSAFTSFALKYRK